MIINGTELETMTFNGQEVDTWIHNGVEVFSGLRGKYIVQDGLIVDERYASGKTSSQSECHGNQSGCTSKDCLTIDQKLVGKRMKLTLAGTCDNSCFNGQKSRFVFIQVDGQQIFTVDLLENGYSANNEGTIEFTPTVADIYFGTYLSRTANNDQITQIDRQTAKIKTLQVM